MKAAFAIFAALAVTAALAQPVPRTADGKPDLSGMWWVPDQSRDGIDAPPKDSLNLAADLDSDDLGIGPWADALMKQRQADMRTKKTRPTWWVSK